MKRLAGLVALALLASLLGSALAAYVKEISMYSGGYVGPKRFAFTVQGSGQAKALRPGGSVSFDFTLSNEDANGVAQVPLRTAISITIPESLAGTGRLVGSLACGGTVLSSSFSKTLEVGGLSLEKAVRDSDTYTLTITWLDADLNLLGGLTSVVFDPSRITIVASAYQ